MLYILFDKPNLFFADDFEHKLLRLGTNHSILGTIDRDLK
jgi:hypothetical protein